MGAWGTGPFDNDGAADWIDTAEQSGTSLKDQIRETLTDVVNNDEYLEVDDGQYAVAAAALAASQLPTAPSLNMLALPPSLADASFTLDDDLRRLAAQALDRVMRPDCELTELWEDDESFSAVVDQLRQALAP